MTVSAVATIEASRFSKFATLTVSPAVWSDPAATEKLTAVIPPAGGEHQRIVAGAAVDRDFRTVERDRIVAAAGIDDIGAAVTVDDVGAGAAGDGVGAPWSR